MKKSCLLLGLAFALLSPLVSTAASSLKITDTYADQLGRDPDTGDTTSFSVGSATINASLPLRDIDISTFNEDTTVDFQLGDSSIFDVLGGPPRFGDDPTYHPGKKSVTLVRHYDDTDPRSPVIARWSATWTETTFTIVASAKFDIFGAEEHFSEGAEPGVTLFNETVSGSILIGGDYLFSGPIYIKGQNTLRVKFIDDLEYDLNNGQLSGQADFTAPTISITTPVANKKYTNEGPVTVTGKALDNLAVLGMSYIWQDDNTWNDLEPDTRTNKFSWSLPDHFLTPGTNTVWAYAVDETFNFSPVVSRSVFYSVPTPLTLRTNGPGGITGQKNGAMLEIGRGYKVTAVPARGKVLWNWTDENGTLYGDSTSLTLNFIMHEGLVLQANFGENVYSNGAGFYYGTFAVPQDDSNPQSGVNPFTAGYLTLTLDKKGTYSAKATIGGVVNPWTGQFFYDTDSGIIFCHNLIKPLVDSDHVHYGDLIASLTLDPSSASIGGEIRFLDYYDPSNSLDSVVLAKRYQYVTNPPPGIFNFALPGADDSSTAPGGFSFGTATISKAGIVAVNLNLADGSPVANFASYMAKDGTFPLYASTRHGRGVFMGWATFPDTNNLQGMDVNWVCFNDKPRGMYYPNGFAFNNLPLFGERYVAPKGVTNIVGWTSGIVGYQGGNLSNNIEQSVTFTNNALFVFSNGTPYKPTLKLTPGTGALTGGITPVTGKAALKSQGVLLPISHVGYGFFKGTNQTGSLFVGEQLPGTIGAARVTPGSETGVTNLTVGIYGDTLSFNDGPLSGVTVDIPVGALPNDAQFSVTDNNASFVPKAGTFPGHVISIHTDGTTNFNEPISITIPFNNDGTTVPVPYYVTPSGYLKPCQVISIDNAAGTLTFQTFHASLYTWLLAHLPDSIVDSLTAGATPYHPDVDGFQVVNYGSSYNPGGECFGMTAFEQWFYREKGGHFYNKYMQDIPLGSGGATRKGQQIIATRAFNSVAREWINYVPFVNDSYNLTPAQRYASIVNILDNTRLPTILNPSGNGSHAVLAYNHNRSSSNDVGVILINDPNYPGTTRTLSFDPAHPDVLSYDAFPNVAIIGDGSLQMENFDNIYRDAQNGFNGNGLAQVNVTSHTDGQSVSDRTVTLEGQIQSGQLLVSQLSVIVNGTSIVSTDVDPDTGAFSITLSLNAGTNQLSFITKGYNANNQLVKALNTQLTPFVLVADLDTAAILVTLTWDTFDTDLDTYMIDPSGDYSSYYHKQTADGGTLDYDNTSGYGPEHWTLRYNDTVRWGQEYTYRVHYYSDHTSGGYGPAQPTRWTVNVLLYEGTPQVQTFSFGGVLAYADGSSNNDPTGTGASWADVCTIVPVDGGAKLAAPTVKKSKTGAVQITVPVPSAEARALWKAADQQHQRK